MRGEQRCFCRVLSMVKASKLGPYKIPYVALANSKEHEVEVRADRRGGRVGRACGTAGPRTSPSDARENFPSEKPNEHESNSPRKARRPARGERLRFLEPERRRTGRPGAGREWEPARNVPQPPPFRRRASLSDGSSRSGRIPRGVVHKSTARSSTCASVSQPKRESPQELRLISPGIVVTDTSFAPRHGCELWLSTDSTQLSTS